MRGSWRTAFAVVAVLAVLLPLAGCTGPRAPERVVAPAEVGYDPAALRVAGVRTVAYNVTSWDGATILAASAVVPVTNDTLPGGRKPSWPLVVFLHGWGGSKEGFAGQQEAFALSGLATVAYDARGFGASGGQSTVAGPAEQSDLASVIADARQRFQVGLVGVVGQSYGGGQALLALAKNPEVATVASHYGWTDLAGGLIPANVPKVWWAQTLYGYGLVGSKARYDPMIHDWYQQLYTRQDLATVARQMDERSAGPLLAATDKPVLLCQGMQETLFPQADKAASAAGGFTRTYIYQGGHGSDDGGCWSRTRDWFKFFLGGYDTRVDAWPELETVDAASTGLAAYTPWPDATTQHLHLRGEELHSGEPSPARFTIRQTVLGTPTNDPSALSDQTGLPRQFLPDGVRLDPTALTFTAEPGPAVLFGAPELTLHRAAGAAPFQVTATLLRLRADGESQVLATAAAAALSEADLADGNLTLAFPWVRATFEQGDRLVLRLASNDPAWWMPLLADYSVDFDGSSRLSVPLQA